MKKLILFTVTCTLLSACDLGKKTESYSYKYSENGCDTGNHNFSSKADLCASLKDEKTNGGCAYATRKDRYEKECGGSMDPAPVKSDIVETGTVLREENNFAYSFTVNGCETSQQNFSTEAALCLALLDEELNKGCAKEIREAYFRDQCEPKP